MNPVVAVFVFAVVLAVPPPNRLVGATVPAAGAAPPVVAPNVKDEPPAVFPKLKPSA